MASLSALAGEGARKVLPRVTPGQGDCTFAGDGCEFEGRHLGIERLGIWRRAALQEEEDDRFIFDEPSGPRS